MSAAVHVQINFKPATGDLNVIAPGLGPAEVLIVLEHARLALTIELVKLSLAHEQRVKPVDGSMLTRLPPLPDDGGRH